MYAAGKELDAMRRLEAAIKSGEDLGDSALRAWGCLFEGLRQGLPRRRRGRRGRCGNFRRNRLFRLRVERAGHREIEGHQIVVVVRH